MEMFRYQCPVCGMIYEVPAYWMSYSPEQTTEFPHMDPATGEMCSNMILEYINEE